MDRLAATFTITFMQTSVDNCMVAQVAGTTVICIDLKDDSSRYAGWHQLTPARNRERCALFGLRACSSNLNLARLQNVSLKASYLPQDFQEKAWII